MLITPPSGLVSIDRPSSPLEREKENGQLPLEKNERLDYVQELEGHCNWASPGE